MIADGFGINAKLVGSFVPDPQTGPADGRLRRPAAGAVRKVRPPPLRLRPRPHGDPDPVRGLRGRSRDFFPWNAALADQHGAVRRQHHPGPNGRPCPAAIRPFNPSSWPAPRTPLAGAFRSFTLKLDRDDGDQFLGDLNFTMPPGFTGSLRGITYCPEAAIAAAAEARPHRAGDPELSRELARSAPPTSPPDPAPTPSTRSGKMYLAGPVQGRAAQPRRDHPGARRPL